MASKLVQGFVNVSGTKLVDYLTGTDLPVVPDSITPVVQLEAQLSDFTVMQTNSEKHFMKTGIISGSLTLAPSWIMKRG